MSPQWRSHYLLGKNCSLGLINCEERTLGENECSRDTLGRFSSPNSRHLQFEQCGEIFLHPSGNTGSVCFADSELALALLSVRFAVS